MNWLGTLHRIRRSDLTTITQAYPKDTSSKTGLSVREHTGGPRGEQPKALNELVGYFTSNTPFRSDDDYSGLPQGYFQQNWSLGARAHWRAARRTAESLE